MMTEDEEMIQRFYSLREKTEKFITPEKQKLLDPKFSHRFLVRFKNFGNISQDDLLKLSLQISSVTQPDIHFDEHHYDDIHMNFKDDIENFTMNAIKAQTSIQKPKWHRKSMKGTFDMDICHMNGGNVVGYWRVQNCWIKKMYFTSLVYGNVVPLEINLMISGIPQWHSS